MKILVITDRIPFPLTNGQNLRIFNFIKNLNHRHDFYLISYGEKPYPPEIQPLFAEIYALNSKPKVSRESSLLRRLSQSLSADGMVVFDPAMLMLIKSVLQENHFEMIWISGWEMLVYATYLPDLPLLADVVDDGILENLRALKHPESIPQCFVGFKRLLQNCLFERKYFTRAAVCNVVSELDAKFVRWVCPGLPVTVVHNGVDIGYFRPFGTTLEDRSLVFEGKIGFRPNVDGVLYFCDEIFPLIRSQMRGVKLYIVGKDPPPSVKALASEHVIVTGYVDDVRPYLDRAALFVCPLRQGAGIKNKILQAWAMAKPVVATPESCGGLRVVPGENIMVAPKEADFAAAVIELLQDRSKREQMGWQGRQTVERYYTWESKSAELDKVFDLTTKQHHKQGE